MLLCMWSASLALTITYENGRELEQVVRSAKTEQRIALRVRTIVGAADSRSKLRSLKLRS